MGLGRTSDEPRLRKEHNPAEFASSTLETMDISSSNFLACSNLVSEIYNCREKLSESHGLSSRDDPLPLTSWRKELCSLLRAKPRTSPGPLSDRAGCKGHKGACPCLPAHPPLHSLLLGLTGRSSHSHTLQGTPRSGHKHPTEGHILQSPRRQNPVTWLRNDHKLPKPQTSVHPSGDFYGVTRSVLVPLQADGVLSLLLCHVENR